MNRLRLVTIALTCSACLGGEGGNPETAPACETRFSGLTGSDTLSLPVNAAGMPLYMADLAQAVENDPRAEMSTWELTVLRDDVESDNWVLRTPDGESVDTSGVVYGIVELTFEDGFVEGERIVLRRDVQCRAGGADYDYSLSVRADVGPAAAVPAIAGVLTVDGSDFIRLAAGPELSPWLDFITGHHIQIGDADFQGGYAMDRGLIVWPLSTEGCQICTAPPSSGPPQVCHRLHWPAGDHRLLAAVSVYGVGEVPTAPLTHAFARPFCAN